MQSYTLKEPTIEAVCFDGEITDELKYHVHFNVIGQQHYLYNAKQMHVSVKKGDFLVRARGALCFAEVMAPDKFHSMYREVKANVLKICDQC